MEIKSKIKRMTLIMMSLFTIFMAVAGNITVLKASETSMEVNITEWAKVHEYMYLPVKCNVGNTNISYTYDENFDRTSKTVDGIVTTYTYEEYTNDGEYMKRYRLVSENRNGEQIEYMYDDVNMGKVTGFTYDGNTYSYQYNEYGSITGIMYDGVLIGTYNYNDDYVSTINYDLSENNIMSINPLRYEGYYHDVETGYYYVNGSYNDLKNGKVVNKNLLDDMKMITKSRAALEPLDQFEVDVDYQIRLNGGIGRGIPENEYMADGAWTSGMSIIEVIARTIYGEFNGEASQSIYGIQPEQYYAQRTAIAWVIRNRIACPNDFGYTLDGIVKAPKQFAALTGTQSQTEAARNPITDHDAWSEAVELAAILYCATYGSYGNYSKDELIANMAAKPQGIDKQKYFVSKETWEDGYTERLHIFHFPEEQDRIVKNIALNVGNIPTNLPRNIFFDFK